MYVTLNPSSDDERILTDVVAVVHDGEGWARFCRDGREDEVIDPDQRWVASSG